MTRQFRRQRAIGFISVLALTLFSSHTTLTAQTLSLLSRVSNARAATPLVRRVNAPFFTEKSVPEWAAAIVWFGHVTPTSNYMDARIGYNRDALVFHTTVFDRRVWYDADPTHNSFAQLTAWDAIALYLDTNPSPGNTPTASSYRLVGGINDANQLAKFRSASRGNGTAFAELKPALPFTVTGSWRGDGYNDNSDARGYTLRFEIPFTSLGLTGAPTAGTVWRLGMRLHDRDDAAGTAIPNQFWPEAMQPNMPNTWGQLAFGMPSQAKPSTQPVSTITIRHGLNGAVPDAPVGGGTECAEAYKADYFTGFGTANYANSPYANVQNQSDVADWPCFSKVYITFPLTALVSTLSVISATFSAVQFGNSGQGIPPEPYPTLVQVLTVGEDWQASTLNWNNAPLAVENLSMAYAFPLPPPPPKPDVTVVWDVTKAVDEAHRANQPLRLVLYSADGAQNSGKYFWTSDVSDSMADSRPTLKVVLGAFTSPTTPTVTPPTPPTALPSLTPIFTPTRKPTSTLTPNPALDKQTYLPLCWRD